MIPYASTLAAMLLVIAGCGYLVAAMILVARRARAPLPSRAMTPSVTILKPLHGDEPGLFENLASFCKQEYSGPVQIIAGVLEAYDAVAAVLRRLHNAHPHQLLDLRIA